MMSHRMMPHCMPFPIPMGRLMLLAIPFAFTLAPVGRIMVSTVNTCMLAAMIGVLVTAMMAAPMSMCHDRCGETA